MTPDSTAKAFQVTKESWLTGTAQSLITPTVSPTVRLAPTLTRTASPTALPSPTSTPLSEEEEYRMLYNQAIQMVRSTRCIDPSVKSCPDELLTRADALLSLANLPEQAAAEPLPPETDWDVIDVSDPSREREIELSISKGIYPESAWCGTTDEKVCPDNYVDRILGPQWLGEVILGATPPTPIPPEVCYDTFSDTDNPWVEALVCPLRFFRIGLGDPSHWLAPSIDGQYPMNKGEWDVLKEKFLQYLTENGAES